jgi:putative transposase
MRKLAVPVIWWYRQLTGPNPEPPIDETQNRKPHPRALSAEEKTTVVDTLNQPAFQDQSVPQVYAALLDQGKYLCSISSMYRILREKGQIHERRNQLRHPVYPVPMLKATQPNQVWTWDITKLPGPYRGVCYFLYLVLDMFSRYVVGWMVANRESGDLASELVEQAMRQQEVDRSQLALHSDRGGAMKSKSLQEKLDDLEVRLSFSRPRVSNDNPYSESQFRTMKYRPEYPVRFGSLEDARTWVSGFVRWYNYEHYHSGIGLMKPAIIHGGLGQERWDDRRRTLQAAFQQNTIRFVKGEPKPPKIPSVVWINEPQGDQVIALEQKGEALFKEISYSDAQ